MHTNRPLTLTISLLVTTLFLFATAGCKEDEQAPILSTGHPGWSSQDCDSCHNLPVEGHDVSDIWACAGCHGGNGACDPNGSNSPRTHTADEDCTSCHGEQHGFTASSQCASCHFAAAGGVADCP
ncbi:MAG: hypothetical protein ABI333_27415 [bacterium]